MKCLHLGMMTLLICVSAVLSATKFQFNCSYDDQGTLGLKANSSQLSSYPQTYNGAPTWNLIAVRELYIRNGAGDYTVKLTSAYGFARSGSLIQTLSDGLIAYKQVYTINGKTMNIIMRMDNVTVTTPMIRLYITLEWPQGVPSSISTITNITAIGVIVYSDHNTFSGSNHSALDIGGSYPLTACDGNVVYDVTPDPTYWGNSKYQALARFYDANSPTATYPIYDIFWWDPYKNTNYLVGGLASDNSNFFNDVLSSGIQTLSTGNYASQTKLSPFVNTNGGKDQIAFLVSLDLTPLPNSYDCVELDFFAQMRVGKKSIQVNWYYNDVAYNDPNRIQYGNSVKGALQGLAAASDLVSDVAITTSQKTLTCSNYGNKDNICTSQELYSLEYYTNIGFLHARLNTAVYLLRSDQRHELGNTVGGAVDIFGTATTIKRLSGAFVFPGAIMAWSGYGVNDVYTAVAHELGHTLGMNHQWSNCNSGDGGGWNCANGTIMSSTKPSNNPLMDYGTDAKTWYSKAPYSWLHPKYGSGLTSNTTIEPLQIINW